MHNRRLVALITLLTAGTLLFSSCAPQDQTTAAPTALPTAEQAAESAPETGAASTALMAMVNGHALSMESVDRIYRTLSASLSYFGEQFSDQDARQWAMDSAVEQTLMDAHAQEWGLALTDEEIASLTDAARTDWENNVVYYMGIYYNVTDATSEEDRNVARSAVLTMLNNAGFTEEDFIREAVTAAQNERVEARMSEGVSVSPEDVQAAYEANVQADEAKYAADIQAYEMDTVVYSNTSWYVPAGYRYISWILLDVDNDLLADYHDKSAVLEESVETAETTESESVSASTVTQADVDAAAEAMLTSVQNPIKEIREKLNAGTPFPELVNAYGIDKTWMSAESAAVGQRVSMDSIVWDPAIVKAAFTINQVGEVSEPFVGNAGVYLVCYMGDVPSGGPELTDALRTELTDTLQTQKESEAISAVMSSWVSEADISYTTEGSSWLKGN